MMLKKTICPYDCPASCGLLAETDGDRIYRMIGDPDHPATHGVICAKVRGYVKSLYHRERLLRPMKRNGRRIRSDILGGGGGPHRSPVWMYH